MARTSLRFLVLTLAITVSYVSAAAQQPNCDVHFSPGTVKPTQLEAFKKLWDSFSSKGQVERLRDLRKVIQDLRDVKSQLADTLTIVSTSNSLQDWQKARVAQIPQSQDTIVTLFRKVSDESRAGGLFADNAVVSQLKVMINAKSKQLGLLCSISYGTLPLVPSDKQELDKNIAEMREEVKILEDIDTKIGDLITQARKEEKANKEGLTRLMRS